VAAAPAATPHRTVCAVSSRTSRRSRPAWRGTERSTCSATAWARDISAELAGALPLSTLAVLDGQGHEAIDTAPAVLAGALDEFLS